VWKRSGSDKVGTLCAADGRSAVDVCGCDDGVLWGLLEIKYIRCRAETGIEFGADRKILISFVVPMVREWKDMEGECTLGARWI
jgi:hypothetical protein